MTKKILITVLFFLVIIAGVSTFFIFNNNSNSERTVLWNEAIIILNNGEVKEVFQAHNLNVTLILKDGTQINTIEPSIDNIFDEVEKCGKPCSKIILATE